MVSIIDANNTVSGEIHLQQFRIFLASPGDVLLERTLARETIVQINGERQFRGRIALETIAWDQPGASVAMEAAMTPQQAIALGLPKPEDCDLVVVILWSRMGTPLPAEFELKQDGTAYLSGTEWEFLNALKGYKTNNQPKNIWVFRRMEEPKFAVNDPNRNSIIEQWEKLQQFLSSFTNPDTSLNGGINPYQTPSDFGQLFERFLRDRLVKLLETLPPPNHATDSINAPAKPIWTESPYPGLEAFTPEQAPIYFGRGREVDQLLSQFADTKLRFVAVVGVSGSGKSSLVKAGLLPRLRTGMIDNAPWIDLIFKPGERGNNPFLALAFVLNTELKLSGQTETELARSLQADWPLAQSNVVELTPSPHGGRPGWGRSKGGEPTDFTRPHPNPPPWGEGTGSLNSTALPMGQGTLTPNPTVSLAQSHLNTVLAKYPHAKELLLVIDQFEELFTQCQPSETADFLKLLEHLVSLPNIRAVVTLRADFYATAIAQPILANLLRQDRGTFPLDLPGTGAIHQMITRPAEAAGVELEDGLASKLLDEAGRGPGAMALIAYTLNQLYEQEQHSRHLTIAAYERLGGVNGAIQQRANTALAGLEKRLDLNTALPKLFAHLVEVNEQEVATRRRALQKDLSADLNPLTAALIDARLLVSGVGEQNQATLEVSHETVLSGWDRLRTWILDFAKSLRSRRDLEQVATEWSKAGQPKAGLRTGNLLKGYLTAAEPRSATANAYLKACQTQQRRMHWVYAVSGVGLLLLIGVYAHVSRSAYPPALATKALFVQLHLWPLDEPKMVEMPAGSFQMGDLSGEGQEDEKPVHTVVFAKPFYMGQFEVSFDEYDLFAAATGRERPNDQGWGRGNRPVINISWDDAVAYTQWLSKRTGLHYRLPSEAEWEYATRADTTTSRFWKESPQAQDDAACTYANVFDQNNEARIKSTYGGITWEPFKCSDDFPFTAPADAFQPNPWRLYNTLGNVWEWTQDCYTKNYDGTPVDGAARESIKQDRCQLRVLRGGSWNLGTLYVRSASRLRSTTDDRNSDIGFRLARTF